MKIIPQAPVGKLNPLATGAAILAAAFLLLYGVLRVVPDDQEPAPPATAAVPAMAPGATPAVAAMASKPPVAPALANPKSPVRNSRIIPRKKQRSAARSAWSELGAPQQQALAPLASIWDGMSQFQRRKWLAMSRDFPSMPLDEQAKLYSRMVEWASLSAQQRVQARLNFADAEELPTKEKEAKWKAYQALSPEERRKFEARAPARIRGAAPALRPAPHRKMRPLRPLKPAPVEARAPDATPNSAAAPKYPPNILATEHRTDPNTLLPLALPIKSASPPAEPH